MSETSERLNRVGVLLKECVEIADELELALRAAERASRKRVPYPGAKP